MTKDQWDAFGSCGTYFPPPSIEYSIRWENRSDLIRTQLQETGRVCIAFLTVADVYAACTDLGIDPRTVEFHADYAVVKASVTQPDSILTVAGKRFGCECGANVFRKIGRVYICNGCSRRYTGGDGD